MECETILIITIAILILIGTVIAIIKKVEKEEWRRYKRERCGFLMVKGESFSELMAAAQRKCKDSAAEDAFFNPERYL